MQLREYSVRICNVFVILAGSPATIMECTTVGRRPNVSAALLLTDTDTEAENGRTKHEPPDFNVDLSARVAA